MCRVPVQLRELLKQRLSAAAEEIFELLEKTLSEYEEQRHTDAAAPVPGPAVGGAAELYSELLDIKREHKEELISTPESEAPPADLIPAKSEHTDPAMELKILEYHSERCAADVWTQTDSEVKGPLSSSVPLLSFAPLSSAPLPSTPLSSPGPLSSPAPLSSSVPLLSFAPLSSAPLFSSAPLSSTPLSSRAPLSSSAPVACSHAPAQCLVCEKPFLTPRELDDHMCPVMDEAKDPHVAQTANTPKPFSCSVCGLRMATRASLRRHTASHSTKEVLKKRVERGKPYSCSPCRRTFSSANGLKQHAKMHNNGKNVSGNTAVEELECRDSNKAGIMDKNGGADGVSIEKMNEKRLESDEAKKNVQHLAKPVSQSDNQVNQIINCPKWQITKKLEVTVYKVPDVEKLLSKLVENKSETPNCEQESGETQMIEAVESGREEYHCPFCHRVYYTELDFRQHKFTHKDEHKCSICSKRFKTMKSLRNHVSVAHMPRNEAASKAPGTDAAEWLRLHETLHVRPNSQPASQKTRWFKCGKSLEDHARSCDGEPFSCPPCEVGFLTEELLATHLLSHPESVKAKEKKKLEEPRMELEAEEMGQKSSESDEHPSPEKTQDSEETSLSPSSESSEPEELYKNELPCPHCKKVFDSRPRFRRHLISHKENLTCPFCERRFAINHRREAHIKSKHIGRGEDLRGLKVTTSDRLFNCKHCPRSFWNLRDAVSHQAFHRANPKPAASGKETQSDQSVLRCGNCTAVFRHRSNWKRHLKGAHPSQTTSCRCFICGERVVGRKKLRQHLEGHLDKRWTGNEKKRVE